MEDDKVTVTADTEQMALVPLTTATTANGATLAADNNTTNDSTNDEASNAASNAAEALAKPNADTYDSSDTTLQSEQDNVALKLNTSDTKQFPANQTLQQLLNAHSEQNTLTAARVEVEQPQFHAADSRNEALDTKNACAAGSSMSATTAAAAAALGTGGAEGEGDAEIAAENETTPTASIRSIGSLVCRICHNSENPERLVSPCFCKGSLTYVHIHCLERWISTSRSTTCELCQFQYNTEQTLRYTCFQSLRMWYSRSMSRRALQEDCQMFSLLTLVAFGIIGTLLVGIQYYFLQGRSWGLGRLWTKGWLIFFLFTTLAVYFINIYMIVRSQLAPWYRWWQSARDIKLILENRKPFQLRTNRRLANRPMPEQLSATAMLPLSQPPPPPTSQQPPPPPTSQQPPEQNPPAPPAQPQPAPVQPTAAVAGSNLQQQPQLPDVEAACKMPLTAANESASGRVAAAAAAVAIPLDGFAY